VELGLCNAATHATQQRMQRNVIESHVMAQSRMQGNVESLVLACKAM